MLKGVKDVFNVRQHAHNYTGVLLVLNSYKRMRPSAGATKRINKIYVVCSSENPNVSLTIGLRSTSGTI